MTTLTELSTVHRLLISRITDLAIDVSLAGRYHAHVSLTPSCWDFSVCVCPADKTVTSAIYDKQVHLHRRGTSESAPANALPEMIAKLEDLLAEGQSS
ncbi:hypothetical protein [Halomonas korlensis]|uniref:Uncharacterized protein n=1 Tax=Halomonas korlensis TaxID=463301 RepID=A0A1I7JLZ2_9GAMM|nr:hypothetical protein [Halomonas korlensis]SFU86222.1 hypothetical protein SAMN04487955_11162 [Halomonas korlensis]